MTCVCVCVYAMHGIVCVCRICLFVCFCLACVKNLSCACIGTRVFASMPVCVCARERQLISDKSY